MKRVKKVKCWKVENYACGASSLPSCGCEGRTRTRGVEKIPMVEGTCLPFDAAQMH